MAILAILGHKTRGNEVIEILKILGGKQTWVINANSLNHCFYINSANELDTISTGDSRLFGKYRAFTLEEFLEKFPYKIGDKVSSKYLKNYKIAKMEWEDTNNRVIYKLQGMGWYSADELQPYKEETMEDPKKVMFEANAQCCDIMNHLIKEETMKEKDEKSANHVFDTEIISFDIAQRDKYELDLQGKFKVVLREGVYYVERIKPQYPKTYEECCDILGIRNDWHLTLELDTPAAYDLSVDKEYDYVDKLEKLRKLFICRNAYWKIAGEQMGLEKPWEPDYDSGVNKYGIICMNGVVQKSTPATNWERHLNKILDFPIAEMRDTFFENFKELIEECKELL